MQRTQTEKIEKFISEYETKIERCYTAIKSLKVALKESRTKHRSILNSNTTETLGLVKMYVKRLAVQEGKKDILVQAKSDFECCL